MKNNLTIRMLAAMRYIVITLLVGGFLLTSNKAICQDKQEGGSKIHVSLKLSYKMTDGVKRLKVKLTRKENGKSVPLDDAKSPVFLYLGDIKDANPSDGSGLLGKVNINDDGTGVFMIPDNINALTSKLHEFKYLAHFGPDPVYDDADEDITISDARISIVYNGKDSVKTATATLTEWKDSAYVPVPDAEMKLGIKRAFSSFTFSDDGATTDKEGKISGNLPLDIPGNPDGTITIVASVIENDNYGTVETTQNVAWNILPKKNESFGRTLWSNQQNAPILLIIISCSIIAAIWGTLIYLVFQLFKIKKLGVKREAKENVS
ncbi:MAG: hypothetical protein ACLQQ4_12135 [Bacteroidia bacterium]